LFQRLESLPEKYTTNNPTTNIDAYYFIVC